MDAAAIFTRFHDAWSAGDLATVRELADPEIVVRPVHGLLFSKPEYRGLEDLALWFDEMTGPWDGFDANVEEVHQTPEGVVGFLHLVGHRGEELFDARVASFCEVRDGRITRITARDIWDVKEEMGV
jgi:ketosteroid isomerase-like protein